MSSQVKSNQVTFSYAALSRRKHWGFLFYWYWNNRPSYQNPNSGLSVLKDLCHGCLVHFVKNANNASVIRWELEKLFVYGKITALFQTVLSPRLTEVFRKKSQSFSILFKFVHPCLFLYLLCYWYLLFMFWAVIFMFHSVRWRSHFEGSLINFVTQLFKYSNLNKEGSNKVTWFS